MWTILTSLLFSDIEMQSPSMCPFDVSKLSLEAVLFVMFMIKNLWFSGLKDSLVIGAGVWSYIFEFAINFSLDSDAGFFKPFTDHICCLHLRFLRDVFSWYFPGWNSISIRILFFPSILFLYLFFLLNQNSFCSPTRIFLKWLLLLLHSHICCCQLMNTWIGVIKRKLLLLRTLMLQIFIFIW